MAIGSTILQRINAQLNRRVAGQGSLLFFGFALAQLFSFARNAILGHWLSSGDFGIAATITLSLQLLESLSDLGVDRRLVQSEDGESLEMLAAAHTIFILRGIATTIAIFLLAHPIAHFFAIPEAAWAFQLVCLAPLAKGLIHLDMRRRQRHFDNFPFIVVEVVPHFVALLATFPAVWLSGDYSAVVYVALAHAAATLVLSHVMARPAYTASRNTATLRDYISFGWPLWLSAIPLIIVLQGDKIIVGHQFGMEQLGAYNAVFMVTMVPGLFAGKIAPALALPILASSRSRPDAFRTNALKLTLIAVASATAFLIVIAVAGGWIVERAFGPNYAGLHTLTVCVGLSWAIRTVQVAPAMALMAIGKTRPILTAGILRASALLLAVAAAMNGFGVTAIALSGAIGELASVTYLAIQARLHCPGFRTTGRSASAKPVKPAR